MLRLSLPPDQRQIGGRIALQKEINLGISQMFASSDFDRRIVYSSRNGIERSVMYQE